MDPSQELVEIVRKAAPSPRVLQYLLEADDRTRHTLEVLERLGVAGKRVCELGPGGVGLACSQFFGADVTAFDCVEDFFKPIYEEYGIPVRMIDLNKSAKVGAAEYDFILFCEVFEHLCRWPLETLTEIRSSMKPGGAILLSTQNLHRLSNRLRMVRGKPLFSNFVAEELVMGHLREYSASELVYLLERAGFRDIQFEMCTFPDLRSHRLVQKAYSGVCRFFPQLSNFIFIWART